MQKGRPSDGLVWHFDHLIMWKWQAFCSNYITELLTVLGPATLDKSQPKTERKQGTLYSVRCTKLSGFMCCMHFQFTKFSAPGWFMGMKLYHSCKSRHSCCTAQWNSQRERGQQAHAAVQGRRKGVVLNSLFSAWSPGNCTREKNCFCCARNL